MYIYIYLYIYIYVSGASRSTDTRWLTLQRAQARSKTSQSLSESLRDFPSHWVQCIFSEMNSSERESCCAHWKLSALSASPNSEGGGLPGVRLSLGLRVIGHGDVWWLFALPEVLNSHWRGRYFVDPCAAACSTDTRRESGRSCFALPSRDCLVILGMLFFLVFRGIFCLFAMSDSYDRRVVDCGGVALAGVARLVSGKSPQRVDCVLLCVIGFASALLRNKSEPPRPDEGILYYTILYYTILYCTILYYTILYYTILYYTIPYYSAAPRRPWRSGTSRSCRPAYIYIYI